MPNTYAPPGYSTVSPYLVAKNAATLMNLVRDIFDAEEASRPEGDDGTLMHGELRIGDSLVMIGEASVQEPLRAMIHVYVQDADATYHRALAAGCAPLEEPNDTPYGDRRGGFTDPAGNQWYVATAAGG